jgi:hypothetical protein
MRVFAVVVAIALAILGCQPKREVRNDAGADSAASRTAPAAPFADGGNLLDAGPAATAPGADAGPPDDALPPAGAPDLALRGKHLLEAIVRDNPELAADFVFPRDAFIASRDLADPAKVWEKKLFASFQRDVHTLNKRLKGKDAQFVSLEVGQAITRIVPKRRDFKKPLWRVKHSKLEFTVDGRPQRIEIGDMTSWRGAWYVTKLR